MKLILTDKVLDAKVFTNDVKVEYIAHKSLDHYNNNPDVTAIVGSRAMAIKAEKMNLKGLRFFQLTSAGFDGVPCEKYAAKGVLVANAGNVYSIPIAETVVFGVLSVAKKWHKNPNNRYIKFQRHYNTITELAGKNLLIMGAGSIGTAIAYRFGGFEMHIDGYDPFCAYKSEYKAIIRSRKELIEKIGKYDYIVSTLPDNEQTKGFINKELFSQMKKSAVIVNVGRKTVFNERDFYSYLKKEMIGGAVLDMFEKIPNPITNKFRRLPNVIVLPGVAAVSQEVDVRLRQYITKNLLAFFAGDEISNIINEHIK